MMDVTQRILIEIECTTKARDKAMEQDRSNEKKLFNAFVHQCNIELTTLKRVLNGVPPVLIEE